MYYSFVMAMEECIHQTHSALLFFFNAQSMTFKCVSEHKTDGFSQLAFHTSKKKKMKKAYQQPFCH